jgi:hypothetical protein
MLLAASRTTAAELYAGRCDVEFEGDSTLHAFTGSLTNLALAVRCDTNAAGAAVLSTRLEIRPRQLTTHHHKRDANMYRMFQDGRYPTLLVVVTNAPLAEAKLAPVSPPAPGRLQVQLTICGITGEVAAVTTDPQPRADGWEFDLQANLSLKAFKLKPPSALFGAISVDDTVKVKAHIVVQKENAQTLNRPTL